MFTCMSKTHDIRQSVYTKPLANCYDDGVISALASRLLQDQQVASQLTDLFKYNLASEDYNCRLIIAYDGRVHNHRSLTVRVYEFQIQLFFLNTTTSNGFYT